MKHKKVAPTEDRIKRRESICAYSDCGGRITIAMVADGWQHCSWECYYADVMDEHPDPEEDEDGEQDI